MFIFFHSGLWIILRLSLETEESSFVAALDSKLSKLFLFDKLVFWFIISFYKAGGFKIPPYSPGVVSIENKLCFCFWNVCYFEGLGS